MVSSGRRSILSAPDWSMILLYLLFVFIGLLNIYSSSYSEAHPGLLDFGTNSGKQVLWIGISLVIAVFILLLESSFLKNLSWIYFGVVVFMLVAVMFFPPIKGARSWFGFGSVGIQPSEFAKSAVALALAKYLSDIGTRMQDFRTRLNAGLIIIVPALLIMIQPDPGTTLVFAGFTLVLYREGISGNILMFGVLAIVLAILTIFAKEWSIEFPLMDKPAPGQFMIILVLWIISMIVAFGIRTFVRKRYRRQPYVLLMTAFMACSSYVLVVDYSYDNILKDRHRDRIELFLGLKEDPDGEDYNRNRAMAAVGSGGWSGKGYKQAILASANLGHVPEQSTDFAYCTLSEEWGWIGSSTVVVLFVVFLIKIISVAERQRSQFSRIYGYGVAAIFFMHFMINIGMTIGLAPVIGIPLPFISYGGSSLLAFTVLLFILIKLDSDRKEILR